MATGYDPTHRRCPSGEPCGSDEAAAGCSRSQTGAFPMWNQWQNFQGIPPGQNKENGDIKGNVDASSPRPGAPQPSAQYRTAHEYAMAVQQWLWQCQMWNTMNWFYMTLPFYTMTAYMSNQQLQQPQRQMSNGRVTTGMGPGGQAGAAPPLPGARPGVQGVNGTGEHFLIPPLWKRVTAEFIDFFVLFLIKLAVTILTVEYVGIVDVQKYNIDVLLNQNIDYNTAFAMTSELIAMEIINRIFICIFETLCLRRGVAGTVGGTTPGKRIMGLRVISCEQITEVAGTNLVRIQPAGDIGFWNALVRSVIKNFSLAFFFPVCFTVFFFQNNRAAYDIISNCIVVEDAS